MLKLCIIGILLINSRLILANEYCELEALYCESRSHVGCNKVFNSNPLDEIIELTPYLHQRLLQNVNKFRNEVALGLRKGVTHMQVANMNILKWNQKLELLSANASIQLKQNSIENLCYATSEYTEPAFISTDLIDEHEIKDINTGFIDRLTSILIEKYERKSALSNPFSHNIGCAVTKVPDKISSFTIACILYGNENIDNFKYGKPCSNCESYGCDATYQGLCTSHTNEVMTGSSQNAQDNATQNNEPAFELTTVHIVAVYVLLGGLVLLIILMLVLIKYLCQYNSHISL